MLPYVPARILQQPLPQKQLRAPTPAETPSTPANRTVFPQLLDPLRGACDPNLAVQRRVADRDRPEVRDRLVITSLRLLVVLNVLSRSDAERKSLLISVAQRYERAGPGPQKYASARRAARASY